MPDTNAIILAHDDNTNDDSDEEDEHNNGIRASFQSFVVLFDILSRVSATYSNHRVLYKVMLSLLIKATSQLNDHQVQSN